MYATIHEDAELEIDTLSDRQPMAIPEQRRHVVISAGIGGKPNGGMKDGLQSTDVAAGQADERDVAVIEPRRHEADNKCCSCCKR